MDLSNYLTDSNKNHSLRLSACKGSCTSFRVLNPITSNCHPRRFDNRRKCPSIFDWRSYNIRIECYQAQMAKSFNKKVQSRSFQVEDLVLSIRKSIIIARKTWDKFQPKPDGLFLITHINQTYQ